MRVAGRGTGDVFTPSAGGRGEGGSHGWKFPKVGKDVGLHGEEVV